jgi:hypothetical protein
MTLRTWLLTAALAGAAAGPALAAREPFDDLFFVKSGATAAAMFADRTACTREALALDLGSSAAAYSNPQYGALAAMGAALDSDALHSGGLKKRMQRAALFSCMHRRGWQERELGPGDRQVARARPDRPQALDAWLKANEPAAAPPPVRTEVTAKAEPERPSYSAEPPDYVKAAAARPAEAALPPAAPAPPAAAGAAAVASP